MAIEDLKPSSLIDLIPGSSSSKMKLKDAYYKSLEGKQAMMQWENKMKSRLSADSEEIWVNTRFGPTYVLAEGPKDAEPMITLHGWGNNGLVYVITNEFKEITKSFRTYTVDVIGQPGQSALQTPPIRSTGYADWIQDVMDGLGIEKAHFLGTSFGGWLTLRFGCQNPEAIIRATILCPAGLANPRMDPSIPYYFYRAAYFPTRKNASQFVNKIILSPKSTLEGPVLEDMTDLFHLFFEHFQTNAEFPITLEEELLENFSAPTLLLIGQDDLLFPAEQVVERAKESLQNLVYAEVLPDTGHGLEQYDYVGKAMLEHFLGNPIPTYTEFRNS